MNELRITNDALRISLCLNGGVLLLLALTLVLPPAHAGQTAVKFTTVYIPEMCQVEQSVDISFTARVTGAEVPVGGITVSFSKPLDVGIISSTMSSAKVYHIGSEIWHKGKNAIKSTHLMAEGWQEGWDEEAQHFLRLRITPKQVSEFDIYFRATVKDDALGEYVNSVSEGVLDQQGWLCEERTIRVLSARDMLKGIIKEYGARIEAVSKIENMSFSRTDPDFDLIVAELESYIQTLNEERYAGRKLRKFLTDLKGDLKVVPDVWDEAKLSASAEVTYQTQFDVDGDGTEELVKGIFYERKSRVHAAIYRLKNQEYVLAWKREIGFCYGTIGDDILRRTGDKIYKIEFSDVNGDGLLEMIVSYESVSMGNRGGGFERLDAYCLLPQNLLSDTTTPQVPLLTILRKNVDGYWGLPSSYKELNGKAYHRDIDADGDKDITVEYWEIRPENIEPKDAHDRIMQSLKDKENLPDTDQSRKFSRRDIFHWKNGEYVFDQEDIDEQVKKLYDEATKVVGERGIQIIKQIRSEYRASFSEMTRMTRAKWGFPEIDFLEVTLFNEIGKYERAFGLLSDLRRRKLSREWANRVDELIANMLEERFLNDAEALPIYEKLLSRDYKPEEMRGIIEQIKSRKRKIEPLTLKNLTETDARQICVRYVTPILTDWEYLADFDWSADGQALVFVGRQKAGQKNGVWELDLKTEKLGNMGVGHIPKYFSKYDVMAFRGRRLVHLRNGMEWLTLKDIAPNDYFPSPRRGYIVYYSECSAGFDVGCYNLSDRIEKVFDDKEGKWLGWKSDTEAIFRLRDGSLEIYNVETGAFRPAKKQESQYGLPDAALSPDKSKHIYIERGICWVANVDGTHASPLKVELKLTPSLQPLWSPDGTQILVSDRQSAKLLVLGLLK